MDVRRTIVQTHTAQHLHEAVDTVRRREACLLRQAGGALVVGTKHRGLKRPKDMRLDRRATFRAPAVSELTVAGAWALKECALQFWEDTSWGAAQRSFERWFYRRPTDG